MGLNVGHRIQQLVNGGVFADTPRADVRFVRVTNVASIVGLVAVCIYCVRLFMLSSPNAPFTLLQIPPMLLTLALNRRGHHRLATLVLATSATVAFGTQPFVFGMKGGHSFFYLTVVAAAPLAFRKQDTGLMWGFIVTASVAYMAFNVIGYKIEPFTLFDDATLHTIAVGTTSGVLVVILVTSLYARRETFAAERDAEHQHQRSEELLASMLPAAVAHELKAFPERTLAARYDTVTVVFADIVGFSSGASKLSPNEVVERLDEIFSAFDALAERTGMEKIKTVGDAYMAAAGVPQTCADQAERALKFARLMHEAAAGLTGMDGKPLVLRIGVHTGPVVAGVIGRQKPAYDLWGDTVNIASRMESAGIAGRTQITAAVRAARDGAGDDAGEFSPRGVIEAKGIGRVQTWLSSAPGDEPS